LTIWRCLNAQTTLRRKFAPVPGQPHNAFIGPIDAFSS
jgi:hypothetical protein